MSDDVRHVLRDVVGHLRHAGIPFMVTGSFASAFYGAPRMTNDIDIVVDPTEKALRTLLKGLPPENDYFSEEAAIDALRHRSMLDVIHIETARSRVIHET